MFKFSLLDLFLLTALLAVAALLYSLEYKGAVLVWTGGVVGYEIGRRTEYWVVWMVMIGMVLGLWIWLGTYLSIGVFNAWRNSWSNGPSGTGPHPVSVSLLFLAIWLVPGLLATWLGWSLFTAGIKKPSSR